MRSFVLLAAWLTATVAAVAIPEDLEPRQAPPAAPGKVIPVTVGSPTREKSLRFYPDNIKAAVGDTIEFQFWPNNHTVTQASGPDIPCRPAAGGMPPVNSGFIPGAMNGMPVGTFSMQVKSMEPMYMYCATNPHCALGMVLIINPKADADLETYRKSAMAKNETVYGNIMVSGGQVGSIPMMQAKPPPT